MSDTKINPDDPRLTAYALGELEGEAEALVEAAIAADPNLAAEVENIRAMAGDLADALGEEALPEVEPVELFEPEGKRIEFPLGHRKRRRFPYYWVSGLAAAGFAVLIVFQSAESPIAGREGVAGPAATAASQAGQSVVASTPESERTRTPLRVEIALPEAGVSGPALVDASIAPAAVVTDESAELSRFEVDESGDDRAGSSERVLSADHIVQLEAAQQPDAGLSALPEGLSATRPLSIDSPGLSRDNGQHVAQFGTVLRMQNDIQTGNEEQVIELSPFTVASVSDRAYASNAASAPALRSRFTARSMTTVETEGYAAIEEHGWMQVAHAPLSTFGVDVDSASYANVRRFLLNGNLPPMDAVKVEELVNAFTYDYAEPSPGAETPLRANLEVASAPWAPQHRLVRIGLKARETTAAGRAPANLVFLLDVSGSMHSPQKLPLVKEAMRLLVGQLREDDRVAIVTYAGQSGLALPSTPVRDGHTIRRALDALRPGGSTHGSSGIHLAYDVAKANFVEGGVNRVILCTDGDFNVGTTGLTELKNLVAEKAKSDVFLTALGFGTGNYQDDTLETLANRGNGQHGYIDSVREARRLLVEQVSGTLETVARDVKIQVEFNPAQVQAYRLIGYNNRRLAAEDFNDDAIDAGEIGAGHTVTALYEVVPSGAPRPASPGGTIDALRYQTLDPPEVRPDHAHELLVVKLRAQPPEGGASRLHEFPLVDAGRSFAQASPDFKFAAAVAGFGLRLRERSESAYYSYTDVRHWAEAGITIDPGGYRAELLALVRRANELSQM